MNNKTNKKINKDVTVRIVLNVFVIQKRYYTLILVKIP